MHLNYTERTSNFKDGENYRNPRYFTTPDKRATSVSIEGNYPDIAEAYEKLGVKVISPQSEVEDKSKRIPKGKS